MDKKIAIAIPASVISDTPHLREKTSKVGFIGRTAAIFRVTEVIIYSDNPKVNQSRDQDFIALLLNYLETPQYLRKKLFKIEPQLQFAGILPPLRTPHHPMSAKSADLNLGEYREGVVISQDKEGLSVDIGIDQPALLREKSYATGDRLTLQIVKIGKDIEVQTVNKEDVPAYWGFKVRIEERPFGQIVTNRKFDLIIATAKQGTRFSEVAREIGKKWNNALNVLVAFGAPSRGLYEIAKAEGEKLEDLVDFVVNTIPEQGTATIRTEEALLATLSVLNVEFDY